MTPTDLAAVLIVAHLDDGVETLTAHECEESEGMSEEDINEAVEHANGWLRAMVSEVCL